MSYNPNQPMDGGQPSLPFVEFISNDQNLTAVPRFTMENFTHSLSNNTGSGEFSITLFDPEWTEIESILFGRGGDLSVQFAYGYKGGVRSQVYNGIITNVSPSYDESGVKLAIKGSSQTILSHLSAQNKTFTQLSISDIVIKLAKERGYKIGHVEPTVKVTSLSDKASHRNFMMAGQSLHQFVNTVLVPYAVSASSGRGGYIYSQKDMGRNGVQISFAPPNLSPQGMKEKIVREYIFIRDKNSEVISWDPEIDLLKRYGQSGGVIEMPYIDPFTKQVKVMNSKPSSSAPSKKQKLRVSLAPESKPNRVRVVPAQTELDIRTRQKAVMDAHIIQDYMEGNLSVLGDPLIPINSLIRLLVFTNRSVEHYTSGIYFVQKADHSIQDGQYTTALELKSDTSQDGTEKTDT